MVLVHNLNLAGVGCAGHLAVVAVEHSALDFAAHNTGLNNDLRVVAACLFNRGHELLHRIHLGNTEGRTCAGRLHEHGEAQLQHALQNLLAVLVLPLAVGDDLVGADFQASGFESNLHEVLVHTHSGCGHAATHIVQVSHFQQTLHGAVLAEGAVQQREHNVHRRGAGNVALSIHQGQAGIAGAHRQEHLLGALGELCGTASAGGQLGELLLIGQVPAAVTGNTDSDDVVGGAVNSAQNAGSGNERNRVLGGAATAQQGDGLLLGHIFLPVRFGAYPPHLQPIVSSLTGLSDTSTQAAVTADTGVMAHGEYAAQAHQIRR